MTATIESTDGRSIDLNDTNADFIAVPRSEWEYLHDRIDDLKRELEDHKQYDGKRHAQANSRLTTVENDVDDMNVSTVEDPDPEAEIPDENPDEDGNGTSTDATAVTPMERLIQYSEDAARRYHTCCDGGHATEPPTVVMTPG